MKESHIHIAPVADNIPFQPSEEFESVFTQSQTVRQAIEESYVKAKGIRTYPFELHFVSGTGLNTSMSNGSFFRVRPGTFNSGSYSGYPAAFPLQVPFNSVLFSIVLTFRRADFDFGATAGLIRFEIEVRKHLHNGSDITNRILVKFGNFGTGAPQGWGSATGDGTFRYELFYAEGENAGFEYIQDNDYNRVVEYGELIGCRFVKAPAGSGDRRINSFRDIVMKLNFEESVS